MIFAVERRGVMLEVWVRLGDEMGEIWKVFGVLVFSGMKDEEMLIFGRERGWILGSLRPALFTGECTRKRGRSCYV